MGLRSVSIPEAILAVSIGERHSFPPTISFSFSASTNKDVSFHGFLLDKRSLPGSSLMQHVAI